MFVCGCKVLGEIGFPVGGRSDEVRGNVCFASTRTRQRFTPLLGVLLIRSNTKDNSITIVLLYTDFEYTRFAENFAGFQKVFKC